MRSVYLNKAVFVLSVGILLVSCCDKNDGNGETYINLETKEVLFDTEGGTLELSFKTSAEWTAVMYHTSEKWCTINKSSGGKGKAVLVISADENESFDERNTAVQIRCKDISEKVIITQKQKNAILLSSNRVEIDHEGGDRLITVKSNVDYECAVETGSDWISIAQVSETKGLDENTLCLKISKNNQFEKRQGVVFVSSDSLRERIDVYQASSIPKMILSANELVAKSAGDTLKVEVTSNCDYSCSLPELDWISETESGKQSAFTHYFALTPNVTSQSRTVTIVFTNLYNGSKEELTIIQLPKNAITTARSLYNLNTDRKEILLKLNSNVDFDVDVPADWIHVNIKDTSEPLSFYDISMVVDENTTHYAREAFVSFYTVELVQRVLIRQDGRSDHIKAVISHEASGVNVNIGGDKLYGFVDWDDGKRDDLIQQNQHVYSDTVSRSLTMDCWGANSIELPSLTGISSIEIYVNGNQNGNAENFVVEKKSWD